MNNLSTQMMHIKMNRKLAQNYFTAITSFCTSVIPLVTSMLTKKNSFSVMTYFKTVFCMPCMFTYLYTEYILVWFYSWNIHLYSLTHIFQDFSALVCCGKSISVSKWLIHVLYLKLDSNCICYAIEINWNLALSITF